MNLHPLTPKKALNKAFLKVKPIRTEIEGFKAQLTQLLDQINDKESEEHHKNLVSDFLKKTYYDPDYFINTKGRNDLVIHTGKDAKTAVGVIIEAKKPNNTNEMVRKDKLNAKALQELVLYYLRERITHKNLEVKHLVITNIYEWFLFDANVFDKAFAQDKALVKKFNDFEAKRLAGTTTDIFYKEIAEPAIAKVEDELTFTYFDLRKYEQPLRNADKTDDHKLIALFKLLSPEHLLKLPFTNDSNSLDKKFYAELLHLIGLTETKQGSKKVIERLETGKRNSGSLLESTIIQLDSRDKISRLDKPAQYGDTHEERLFNVALELVITWVNRILFLKLLEAQLITYHKGDKAYAFLNSKTIHDYDALDTLFFQVLAKRLDERNDDVRTAFARVPYLNSSLFEPTDLEHDTIFISNLRDDKPLPILSATVLKDDNGKKLSGERNTLDYFFAFLDAYDFASEGSEDIQEENKSLINASVLGLIFEKINGYKDGSFFTPGFITMYMCRETLRRAVVQKFNDVKGWNCQNLDELYDKIADRNEANDIVNSLKICDPAVGSGHFLVSALNELIAIKNDLRILQDRDGKRLKEYQVEVVNDELIVTDEEDELFEYNPTSKESQRVQEALFHEKQTIIENCLFGVDINPNSVKICRLRLWIELLKHAYYKPLSASHSQGEVSRSDGGVLETLPNIDINIKQGNSLISRFALDDELKSAFKKTEYSFDDYKRAVRDYKHSTAKEHKRELLRIIREIKHAFQDTITSKVNDKVAKARGKVDVLKNKLNNLAQFNMPIEKKDRDDLKKAEQAFARAEQEREEILHNVIYRNAFEWRFEFPEVLNDDGDYLGFDVVIGNPPYIRQEDFSDIKPFLQQHYETYAGTADLLVYFIELGMNVMHENGVFNFIISNKFMRANFGKPLRTWLQQYRLLQILDFGDLPVFEEATTYPCVLFLQKSKPTGIFQAANIPSLDYVDFDQHVYDHLFNSDQNALNEDGWNLANKKEQDLLQKLRKAGIPLGEYVKGNIYYGIKTGLNEAFVIDEATKNALIAEDPKSADIIKPFLAGRDIKRYQPPKTNSYLILFEKGWTNAKFGEVNEDTAFEELTKNYPSIAHHLNPFKAKAKKRYDKGEYWWELRACDYYEEFEKPKILWPGISAEVSAFAFDENNLYGNDNNQMIITADRFLLGVLNSNLRSCFKFKF